MIELSVTDANHFQNNVQLLKNLVDETLSTKELRQIEERCQPFLDPSMNSSMLQPSNLPCIPLVIKKRVELTTIETSSKRNQRTRSWKTIRNNEDWNAFCRQNFSAAFQSLNVSKIEELQPFVSFFTQDASNCRSRHAGAAIIAQAESFLPSTEARSLIDNIYEEIKPCMRPNDDGFERTNLRVGLLRLAFNDFARAKQALQKAALSNDPKEEQRSLFWLGAIDAYEKGDPKGQIPKVEYWNLLIRRYPLELHSVLVSQILGIDPLKRVISAKPMQWRRRSDTGIDDVDLANLVTEILIAKDAIPTAQHWLNFEQRYVDSPVPEKLLYLGILANRVQSHRESIYYFSRYLRESRTETVSPEFLDLYFPRVFSDVILANSGDIDPVLLFALIRQESAFNRKARSHADARGLMQLLPATANRYRRISKDQLFNPETNVQIGTQFIDNLFERYEGRVEHILSAYNAGPAKITRWQERTPIANQLLFSDLIPYRETRFYVSSILRNAYWYGRILTSRNDSIATETMEKSRKSRWKSALVNKLLSSVWSPTPDASGEKPDLLQFINFHQNTDASSRQKPVILRDLIQELPDFSELDELHKKESDQ
jgi:hypothetical protein